MSQTILNLVTNAVAYGQSGKAVQITVDGEGRDEVVMKVHNHGPAIPADLVPELFEPFRRGVPQDRSPGGLGLGLYIVQQIVLAHDGKIDVESTDGGHHLHPEAAPSTPARRRARVGGRA